VVDGDSRAVGGRQAPTAHMRTHGRLSRRLTRPRRAHLDGDEVVLAHDHEKRLLLGRERRVTVQQPARQPHRALPRAELVATEPQHPGTNGKLVFPRFGGHPSAGVERPRRGGFHAENKTTVPA
jgi:hypothetical protein